MPADTHILVACRTDAARLEPFIPVSVFARLRDKITSGIHESILSDDPFLSLTLDSREAAAVAGVKHAVFEANVTLGLGRISSSRAREKICFFDMDATVVAQESIVELARAAGKEEEVEAITRQAMAGATDFRAALERRLEILKGLPQSCLPDVARRITKNPGIETFAKWAGSRGIQSFIVSGGFTEFAVPLARELGFSGAFAHELIFENGLFTGRVSGEIVDSAGKARIVQRESARLGVSVSDVVAIGDGANDLAMMQNAGLAVGYMPKKILFPALHAANFHGDHRFLIHLLQ
ncbi:phosphoserine phosphatase SerB [bacterium]|nr:phosphoserine phosphatase SerB [bacterium]